MENPIWGANPMQSRSAYARILHTLSGALAPFPSDKFRNVLITRTSANGIMLILLGNVVP
jgi:hypothetical protein